MSVPTLQCPKRTSILCCKNLPKNVPEDHGQLTKAGHEQTFKLGLFLRSRYQGFLEADKPGQLLATHAHLDRCRESLAETIRGLGIPGSPEVDPTRYDLLFHASLIENFDALQREPGPGKFMTIGNLLSFVIEKTEAPSRDKREKFLAMDSLTTYVNTGNPIPSWAQPYWDDFIWADHKIFGLALSGHELWYASNVLRRVLETLSLKFEEGVQRPDKIHLFSMSDSSLYSVLKLFSQSYGDHPSFGCSVLIEVFEDTSKKYVQILTLADDDPRFSLLDSLKNPCELKDFLNFLRGVLKDDKGVPC
ncbi:hypothetical protein V5799_011326 [Amblyomma americanum]|uniref:acid phosphatase n=1 Tax=Amblyomma americanum TaxID=6943 RepID=A0AAQ4EHF8_AMBAM